MEILVIALVVGGITLVAAIIAGVIGARRTSKSRTAFTEYLATIRPDLAPEMLTASRVSKSSKVDIGLTIDERHREIIVLHFTDGEVTHEAYPFSALEAVEVESQIISRGIKTQRTFSYERTMRLQFSGDRRYQYVLENISNKNGTKGTDVVKNAFAPWEKSLTAIAKGQTTS